MKEKLKRFFSIDLMQENQIDADEKDGVIGIILCTYYYWVLCLFAILIYKTQFPERAGHYFSNMLVFKNLVNFVLAVILLLPVFIVIQRRKQPLITVGITKKNLIKSLLVGVLAVLPIAIPQIIFALSQGYTLVSTEKIALHFIYYFVSVAFVEEVFFRGFLFSRLKGLIQGKWARIILVGLAFGVLHIPILLISGSMTLLDFVKYNALSYVIFNIYCVFLYSKTGNIFAPLMFHALNNLLSDVFVITN